MGGSKRLSALVIVAAMASSTGCRPLCNLAASNPPGTATKMKCNSTNGQWDLNAADGLKCGIDKMPSGASATFYNSANAVVGSCAPPGGVCNDTGIHPCP